MDCKFADKALMSSEPRRPKVSVCIAAYNHERYIEECLLSVAMQTFDGDVEILVGDDCSTDRTAQVIREIVDRLPGRITPILRHKNLGPARNYQDLVARAGGEYIAHLDGDDYWLPGKLAAQLEYFQTNVGCVAVYTNALVMNDASELLGTFSAEQPASFDTDYLLRTGNFLNHSSLLYRADAKTLLLGIDREFIDFEMHLRLSLRGALGFVNRHLVCYRAGSTSSMTRNTQSKVWDLYWQALSIPDVVSRYAQGVFRCKCRFVAGILYAASRSGNLSGTLTWLDRNLRETHRGRIRLLLCSLPICASMIGNAFLEKIGHLMSRHKLFVLNRR